MTKLEKYLPSEKTAAAEEELNAHKKTRPGEYRSGWEAQLNSLMERILNREDFHYDLNGDALYRQYKDQAVRNGSLAMMDTMGQAAALTGGYGSSYAQTAGQQAYHQELSTLNDRVPELYALALDRYRQQSQALQQQYELLAGRENQDYSRYQDALSRWQEEADGLWSRYADQRNFDYGNFRDDMAAGQWLTQFLESMRRYDQEWEAAHPAVSPVVYTAPAQKPKTTPTQKKPEEDPRVVLL